MTKDKTGYGTKDYTSRKGNYGRNQEFSQDKDQMHCEHCGMSGHTMATCFKIHGFPDWNKNLINQRMKGPARVNMAGAQLEIPLDCENAEAQSHEDGSHHLPAYEMDLSAIIQKEIMKYMKDKGRFAHAHFAQTSFAGIPFTPIMSCNSNISDMPIEKGTWVIDTAASNHICNDFTLLVDGNQARPWARAGGAPAQGPHLPRAHISFKDEECFIEPT